MVFTKATPFPYGITPLSNISPFTYSDGLTFLEKLEMMRQWLDDSLVPEFNAGIDNAILEFQKGIANAELTISENKAEFAEAYEKFLVDTSALISTINDRVGPADIQRITLAADTTIDIDPLWPTTQPVLFQVKQDSMGGRNITFGPGISGTAEVESIPNALTEFTLIPLANGGWVVFQSNARYADKALFNSLSSEVEELNSEIGELGLTVTTLTGTVGEKIPSAQKGVANGVATLGADSKVPAVQLPPAVVPSLVGTYAARPVASTVLVGTMYHATDVMEQYRSNGAVWQVLGSGGNALGYAELTTDFSTTALASTKADVTGLSITFTAGERPVEIRFGGLLVGPGTTTKGYVSFVLGGTIRAEVGGTMVDGFYSFERGKPIVNPALVPGTSYTFKATAGSATGVNLTVSGDPTNRAYISVVNR